MRRFFVFFRVSLLFVLFSVWPLFAAAQQLGASLYIVPPAENPEVGSNFTLTIKVDSLEQPINAVKGVLSFNKDKVEVVNISKIGSILNLWVEEPQFSNNNAELKFQGGVPRPGFIGNGGTVLLVIFRAKSASPVTLVWKQAEVLAADGKGTNILANLQNLTFDIEKQRSKSASGLNTYGLFYWITLSLAIIIILISANYLLVKFALKYHDLKFHIFGKEEKHEHHEHEHENHN